MMSFVVCGWRTKRAKRGMRLGFRVLSGGALLIWLGACSLGGPVRSDTKATEYTLARLPANWRLERSDPNVDYSYLRHDVGSLISVSSTCRRYDEVSLESLMKDIVRSVDNGEILSSERRPLDGREALMRKVRGQMDGVTVEATFVVLRKDDCIFDFSLMAREALSSDDEQVFTKFIEAFHYEGGARP